MISSRKRLVLVELIAIGAPLVLVYFGRTLLADPGPVAATVPVAAPAVAPPPAVHAKPLTPEQVKAAEWVRSLPKTTVSSPLNHAVEVVIPKTPVIVKDDPPPTPRVNPIRGLKLTGVLGNDGAQLAAINGKIYRIGDEVRAGLKLIEIDARNSRIILETREGEKFDMTRELGEN